MATEVFNRIGEEEIYSENPNFYRRKREEDNTGSVEPDKIESISKPISDAKKEFFEHLNDDSLSIDSCDKLNQDFKKE